jgi:hypothetical protein
MSAQQIETHYLTPRMMANSVHISPILVIVALFIGFSVGGVIGGLIAVPIAGTLMVLARYLVIEPKKDEVAAQRVQGGFRLAATRRNPIRRSPASRKQICKTLHNSANSPAICYP